ncbi:hypothetical protein LTR49_028537, partial [Elasticomyces elasticus]
MATAVASFQWFFWGFSLTFSHAAGRFIGNLDNIGFKNVLAQPSVGSPVIPDLLFAVHQDMFAAITVARAVGAACGGGRIIPYVIFMFIWTTVVYDPIACWTWNPSGWVYELGSLDFAGGTPIHISSGSAALTSSFLLGKRTGYGTQLLNYRPHNVTPIVIGTVSLLVMAVVCTNLAACVRGVTWCLVDYRLERKWSVVGFCSDVIAGLVATTPGSGYAPAWVAVVYGVCAGIGCKFATHIKYWVHADDGLDIFAVHGIGGLIGTLLTRLFDADYITHLDSYTAIPPGWLNRHWIQRAIQLCESVAGTIYSFAVTLLILGVMSVIGWYIPAF